MAARVIDLTGYRKSRYARRRLRIARGPGSDKVLSLCDARRLKKSSEAGKRLRGRNYPDDFLIGPDEDPYGLTGFTISGLNWCGFPMPVLPPKKDDE